MVLRNLAVEYNVTAFSKQVLKLKEGLPELSIISCVALYMEPSHHLLLHDDLNKELAKVQPDTFFLLPVYTLALLFTFCRSRSMDLIVACHTPVTYYSWLFMSWIVFS